MIFYNNENCILNETRVYTNNNENICITVDGSGQTDRGFDADPYFKVYNSSKPAKATKVARIYFSRPEYVKDHQGKPIWNLNSKECKMLNKILANDNVWNKLNEELSNVIQKTVYYPHVDYSKIK